MLANNISGKFITFEGIEGVGKSTAIQLTKEFLDENDINNIISREPGGTKLGEEIRNLLLSNKQENISGETEMLLLFAARKNHLEKIIIPSLKSGKCVLCDRFTDSTYAYQGGGRGVSLEKIAIIEKLVQEDLNPDLTFILDAPYKVGLDRINSRQEGPELDRIEQQKEEFFNNVRHVFLDMAKSFPEKYIIINALEPIDSVKNQIISKLKEKFGQ